MIWFLKSSTLHLSPVIAFTYNSGEFPDTRSNNETSDYSTVSGGHTCCYRCVRGYPGLA